MLDLLSRLPCNYLCIIYNKLRLLFSNQATRARALLSIKFANEDISYQPVQSGSTSVISERLISYMLLVVMPHGKEVSLCLFVWPGGGQAFPWSHPIMYYLIHSPFNRHTKYYNYPLIITSFVLNSLVRIRVQWRTSLSVTISRFQLCSRHDDFVLFPL